MSMSLNLPSYMSGLNFLCRLKNVNQCHLLHNMKGATRRSVRIPAPTQPAPKAQSCKSLISWFIAYNKMILSFSCKEDLHIQFVFPFLKKRNVSNLTKNFPMNCWIRVQIVPTRPGGLTPHKCSAPRDLPQNHPDGLINTWINFNVKEVNPEHSPLQRKGNLWLHYTTILTLILPFSVWMLHNDTKFKS